MQLSDALDRIRAIHNHVARGESYRGYRPHTLGMTGLLGLLAALLQPWVVSPAEPLSFVLFWTLTAVVAGTVSGLPILHDYLSRESDLSRRKARVIVRQFVPCLFVGLVLTFVLTRPEHRDSCVPLLPGIWALLFGLGTLASVPYLPRGTSAVVLWYFLSGTLMLIPPTTGVPSGWSVGIPFGVGHLLAAGVMLRDQTEGASHDR